MKKLLFALIPLILCSCSHDMNRREIDEINLVHVLGIDYSDDEFILTALYSSNGGADQEDGGDATEEVVKGTGKTPYQALEDIIIKNKKTISLAQTGNYLIGEGAAKKGIDICLDFLTRDETIKMEALIYITQGISASDYIDNAIEEKQRVNEDLEAIKQKQHEMVTRHDNTMVNLINEMKQFNSSILIPYLISEDNSFLIEGYAVFDHNKLKDYLDKETSSGVDFIKDVIRRYPIYLKEGVGLSLSYSKCRLKSRIEDGIITVNIKVDFETMIKEVSISKDIFTKEYLAELTKQQNNYIKKVIEKAVSYSVKNSRDILQIARLIENQHVKKWKDYEEDWDKLVSQVEYEYSINSKIAKTFILGYER